MCFYLVWLYTRLQAKLAVCIASALCCVMQKPRSRVESVNDFHFRFGIGRFFLTKTTVSIFLSSVSVVTATFTSSLQSPGVKVALQQPAFAPLVVWCRMSWLVYIVYFALKSFTSLTMHTQLTKTFIDQLFQTHR